MDDSSEAEDCGKRYEKHQCTITPQGHPWSDTFMKEMKASFGLLIYSWVFSSYLGLKCISLPMISMWRLLILVYTDTKYCSNLVSNNLSQIYNEEIDTALQTMSHADKYELYVWDAVAMVRTSLCFVGKGQDVCKQYDT